MTHLRARGLFAIMLSCCIWVGVARAADPLPANTRLVAAANAAAPTELMFNIATTQDLVVTLKDLQIPGELVSAGVVVTQAGAIAGSAQLAAPATSATFSLPAAKGDFTLYVFGVPNAGYSVGTFTACVAPKNNPSSCIQSASLAGNITAQSTATDQTISTLDINLNVTVPGTYTFDFADLQFPAALNSAPQLALFQGSNPIQINIASGSAIALSAGTYTLLAIAQADQATKSGVYGIKIAGPATLLDAAIAVGLINAAEPFNNPSTQVVTLKVSDYAFPGPLASASALLTAGATALGTSSAAGGAVNFTAPAGALNLWTYGSAGATAGTFSADVAGTTDLHTAAQGIGPSAGTYAYAFVAPLPGAGTYQATVADLQFPSQLTALSFAVAQGGVILKQSPAAATLNVDANASNLVLLVAAQPPTSGSASANGLFDVNLQSTAASPQLVFDKTQSVSGGAALFDSQSLTLGVSGSFDANLADLQFPVAFDDLAFVVSRGSQVLGKIYGAGTFSFAGSPGTYQLTFVATPSAQQQFGLYGSSIVFSPPTVTLTSDVSTAQVGAAVQLTWSAINAASCTASGGSWTGSKATAKTTEAVVLSATTTYTLTCAGAGGTVAKSVAVTATPKPASSGGGGGRMDPALLILGAALAVAGQNRRRRAISE